MSRKNLLICFDAFGTLFQPRQPVAKQYADVATSLGLRGLTEEAVERSFKAVFKDESKRNPNYGKANGLNAEKWWSNIITNTFTPLLQKDQKIPSQLVANLLHRFWSKEGYELLPNANLVLRGARNLQNLSFNRVLVGVITNSDDRVPDVLDSLGVKVRPLRYGASQPQAGGEGEKLSWDVDFAVMSYDVGVEKPDRKIFEAAEELTAAVLERDQQSVASDQWEKIYVGDSYKKDVLGAVGAGWSAVLVGEETSSRSKDLSVRDGDQPGDLADLFASSKAVGFNSLANFARWLR